MTTYVLIPQLGSPTAAEMSLGEDSGVRGRAAALRALLARVRPDGADGAIAASDARLESIGGILEGLATDVHSEALLTSGAPRPLEAIGAVIVDDLDENQIDWLIEEGVDVVENFQIELEAPVSQADAETEENWHLDHVGIAAARAEGLTGSGVRIGILDTGIDATHAEFIGRNIDFMEFDARGFKISATPRDAGDHGTHVAGIAAGATCGIAPNANLSVASVLTFPNASGKLAGYFAQILAGANWLLQSNFGVGGAVDEVDVINASLGGLGYRPYLYSILSLAQTVPATQLIASIGNAGPGINSHGSPGNYDIVLGVGAHDKNNVIAGFSSWGNVAAHAGLAKPDLAAPGVDIRSAKPGGGYQIMSGTSMASPVVVGASALFMERHPTLKSNPSTLRQILLQNTIPENPTMRFGRGRIDLSGI